MFWNKALAVGLLAGIWVLGIFLAPDSITHAAPGKDPPKLDDSNYRLKVETIFEPVDKVAIYRVEIWTTQEREVYLDYDDGASSRGGLMRRQKNGGYYAYFVIHASIREPEQKGGKAQLEFNVLTGAAPGGTFVRDDIEKPMQLSKVVNFSPSDRVHKLNEKQRIGRFRGKAVEIGVEELRFKKK